MASTIWSGSKVFTAPSATATTVAIPMPHRGILSGYTLSQTSGTNAGFTANLYTSNQDTAPNSEVPENVFHLITITAANNVATAEDTALNVAYVNRDGTPTLPQRYLYLKITPAGSGEKAFVFSVTVETPMLR